MLITAIDGFCMALADSVPGVSGSTVAYLLGFYECFINSLHDLAGGSAQNRRKGLVYLLRLGTGWVTGMGLSVLFLAKTFETDIYFLCSLFFGLTAVSIPFIIVRERAVLAGRYRNLVYAAAGMLIVYAVSVSPLAGYAGVLDFHALAPARYPFLFASGILAVSAMLLPGISGSTFLLILGVYLPAVTAVRDLIHLDAAVVPGLLALVSGIAAGAVISVRFIRLAIMKYRSAVTYLILGLVAGSLYAIQNGPATLAVPHAPLSAANFSVPGFFLGAVVLSGLEAAKSILEKRA